MTLTSLPLHTPSPPQLPTDRADYMKLLKSINPYALSDKQKMNFLMCHMYPNPVRQS